MDELDQLLSRASVDERRIFTVIARKVMTRGRRDYGPTILANDPRDFRAEGADELLDYLFYAAAEEVRRNDISQEIKRSAAALVQSADAFTDEEPTTERTLNRLPRACSECEAEPQSIHARDCSWSVQVPAPGVQADRSHVEAHLPTAPASVANSACTSGAPFLTAQDSTLPTCDVFDISDAEDK